MLGATGLSVTASCSAYFVGWVPAESGNVVPHGGMTACDGAGLSRCEGRRDFAGKNAKKEGVHNVHTWGFGLGCTGIGRGRIVDVFGGVAGFRGLAPGSSPTSGTCFPC